MGTASDRRRWRVREKMTLEIGFKLYLSKTKDRKNEGKKRLLISESDEHCRF